MSEQIEEVSPVIWCRALHEPPECAQIRSVVGEDPDTGMLIVQDAEGIESEIDPSNTLIEPYTEVLRQDLSELEEVTNVLGAVEILARTESTSLRQVQIGAESVVVLSDGSESTIENGSLVSDLVSKAIHLSSDKETVLGLVGPSARDVFIVASSKIDSTQSALELLDLMSRRQGNNAAMPFSCSVSYQMDEQFKPHHATIDQVDFDAEFVALPEDLKLLSCLDENAQKEFGVTNQTLAWITTTSTDSNNNSTSESLGEVCRKTGISFQAIQRIVAIILHIGSIQFARSGDKITISSESTSSVSQASTLMGVETGVLEEFLCAGKNDTNAAGATKKRLCASLYKGLIQWTVKQCKKSSSSNRQRTLHVWMEDVVAGTGVGDSIVRSHAEFMRQEGLDETEIAKSLGLGNNNFTAACKRASSEVFSSDHSIPIGEAAPWIDLRPSHEIVLDVFRALESSSSGLRVSTSFRNKTRFWVRCLSIPSPMTDYQQYRSQLMRDLQATGALLAIKAERTLSVHEALYSELSVIARSVRAQDEFDDHETSRRVLTSFGASDMHFGSTKVFFRGASSLHRLIWSRRVGRKDDELDEVTRKEVESSIAQLRKEHGKTLMIGTPTKRPASLRIGASPIPSALRKTLPSNDNNNASSSSSSSSSPAVTNATAKVVEETPAATTSIASVVEPTNRSPVKSSMTARQLPPVPPRTPPSRPVTASSSTSANANGGATNPSTPTITGVSSPTRPTTAPAAAIGSNGLPPVPVRSGVLRKRQPDAGNANNNNNNGSPVVVMSPSNGVSIAKSVTASSFDENPSASQQKLSSAELAVSSSSSPTARQSVKNLIQQMEQPRSPSSSKSSVASKTTIASPESSKPNSVLLSTTPTVVNNNSTPTTSNGEPVVVSALKTKKSAPRIPTRRVEFAIQKITLRAIANIVLGLIRARRRARMVRETIGMEGYVRIGKTRESMTERYCMLRRRHNGTQVELFSFTSESDGQKYFFSYQVATKKWEADVEDSWMISECIQAGSWLKLIVERTNDELWVRTFDTNDMDSWERALMRFLSTRRRSSLESNLQSAFDTPAPPLPASSPSPAEVTVSETTIKTETRPTATAGTSIAEVKGSLGGSAKQPVLNVSASAEDVVNRSSSSSPSSLESSTATKEGNEGQQSDNAEEHQSVLEGSFLNNTSVLGEEGEGSAPKRSSLKKSGSAPPARPPPRAVTNQSTANIVKELLDTERLYVNDLHNLILHYRRPLELELTRDENKALISHADMNAIFGNVAQVLKAHQELLNSLDDKQAIESFAQAFVEMMPFLRGIYSMYVQNYPVALSTLAKCTKQRAKFASFVQSVAQARSCPDLESFLIKPIQRLCKYPLFMKQLDEIVSKEDGQEHLKQAVKDALAAVNKVAAEVNVQQRDAARLARGQALASGTFEGLPRSLCEPGRIYLDEFGCEVTRTSNEASSKDGVKTKYWYAFLFSDALIFAKKLVNSDKYKFRAWLDLEHVAMDVPIKNTAKAIDIVHYPHMPAVVSSNGGLSSSSAEDTPSPGGAGGGETPSKKALRRGSVIFKKLQMVARPPPGSSANVNPLGGSDTIEKFYMEFDLEDDRNKAWQALTDAINALHATKKDLAQRMSLVKSKSQSSLVAIPEDDLSTEKRKSLSKRTSMDLDGTFIELGDSSPETGSAQQNKLYKELSDKMMSVSLS